MHHSLFRFNVAVVAAAAVLLVLPCGLSWDLHVCVGVDKVRLVLVLLVLLCFKLAHSGRLLIRPAIFALTVYIGLRFRMVSTAGDIVLLKVRVPYEDARKAL